VAAASDALALRGVEGFEGLFREVTAEATRARIEVFLDGIAEAARLCAAEGLFAEGPVILSAGGSSFHDLVATKLADLSLGRPSILLLRSGCYLTHDSLMYQRAFAALGQRSPELVDSGGGLHPALEIWAYVQSRPESQKAILGFGKRDVSHDELPVALCWYRPEADPRCPSALPAGHIVSRLNDQHCHLEIPADSPLRVGDMVGFGISHPCLTFDKWRVLHLVDEAYNVVESIRTYF
jgi:D-serine dehydratase